MRLKTGLRRLIYFVVVALGAKLTFLASISMMHPILQGLDETTAYSEVFSAHLWASGLAGILLAGVDLVLFTLALRRFPKLHNFISDGYSPRFGTLGFLLSRSEFSAGNGLCVKDRDGLILICNDTLLKPYDLQQSKVLGRRSEEVFPPRVAAAFADVERRAIEARAPAIFDLQRHRDVPDRGISAIRITATPIFYENDKGNLAGLTLITRDITEIKLIEQAAFKSRMDYRHLLDNIPMAISVCEFLTKTGAALPEFVIVETNKAGLPMLDETQLRLGTPMFEQFPFLARATELVTVLESIRVDGPQARVELYWEPIGRTFECLFASCGDGCFTVMSKDITEPLQSEMQLLRLNDQLFRAKAECSQAMEDLLTDHNAFMHAVVEVVQEPLSRLRNTTQHIPQAEKVAYQTATLLIQKTMERMQRYANSSLLPFSPGLLDLNITARHIVNTYQHVHPDTVFNLAPLPILRTSDPVFRSILSCLLGIMVSGEQGQVINIYAESRVMDTLVCVGPIPAGCPILGSLIEEPDLLAWTALTWELSDDLDLALVRRLVAYHGGQLMIRHISPGQTYMGFFLGAPVPYLLGGKAGF